MSRPDEHDDDLESEVTEGAAIETDQFEEADDDEGTSGADVTNPPERAPAKSDRSDSEDSDDGASDTI